MKRNLKSECSNLTSVLIANRGEISSRISRTCRKMGIRSIAVFSDADRDALFVGDADVAVHIGGSNPSESYLDMAKIIKVAKESGADAIHPGYGFLSENAEFAKRCADEGIVFIGPHPAAIAAMGSKSEAKNLMQKHGVPIVPGYQGKDQTIKTLTAEAEKIGYPLLLKATAGGGGKGMRIVSKKSEIKKAIEEAKRESKSAFGNDELIVEKYIASGRHIEFQILGDKHGNAIHLLERECTIQRRYQKVIEESPSPVMDDTLRDKMGNAAVNAARALNYDNAGTVEFIYDDQSGDFYFLEVNTRLQVEHPVTEEVIGVDLVQLQIECAQGNPLSLTQKDIVGKGYAIEVRLYAEDADNDFLPVTGKVELFDVPEVDDLRVESAIQSGSNISVFYDPMIAKLIVWGQSRREAHRKMQYVLAQMTCLGTKTNQHFLLNILKDQDFNEGRYDTHYIADKLSKSAFSNGHEQIESALIAATLHGWHKRQSNRNLLKAVPSGWRNSFYDYQTVVYGHNDEVIAVKYKSVSGGFQVFIGEKQHDATLIKTEGNILTIEIEGYRSNYTVIDSADRYYIQNEQTGNVTLNKVERFPKKEKEVIKGGYKSPMPSQVIKVLVQKGDKVKSGDGIIILSSMKMENTLEASEDGEVEEIYVSEGQNVEADVLLLKMVQ